MDDLVKVNDGRLTLLQFAPKESRGAQHLRQRESPGQMSATRRI